MVFMDRRLWLLRHAKTTKEPPAGGGDRQRELNAVGKADAAELRELLESAALGIGLPERVLFSEAVRTAITAEIVFGGLVAEWWGDSRLYGADPDDVLRILAELPDEISSIAIVGHNPTIHELSLLLAAPEANPFAERHRPGELCVLRTNSDSWSALGQGGFGVEAAWRLSRP